MKKIVIASILALALVLSLVGIASAITNGEPDNGRHPYVGLLIFDAPDEYGVVAPAWRCSGSLIAPDVVLTAGHCTDGAVAARVWFDEGPVPWGTWDPDTSPTCGTATGYPCKGEVEGTPITNPNYCSECGNGLPGFAYRDVGIVLLDEPVDMDEFAELPDAGLVDTLKNKAAVDNVGYGVQEMVRGGGPPYWTGLRVRLYAPSEFVSGKFVHSDEFIKLSLNASQGKGGTCFGDSGGPNLLGDTNTVLAVNSYVTNYNCAGVGYSSRVDIPEVLEWIEGYLPQE
ncbi:MAG: trypsin-like serine protease [Chloroflexi bacterium]|nr:trypsin-like serine protease [Chloroflexota bacterium]